MNKGIVDIFGDLNVSLAHPFGHEGTLCWLWEGRIHPKGYGDLAGKLAHRVAWEMANGEIPEGLEIHHLCRIKRCCNPLHLTATTPLAHQQSHVDGTPLAHAF